MWIRENVHQYCETVSIDSKHSVLPLPPETTAEHEFPVQNGLKREDLTENVIERNRFFEGFIFILPFAILFWSIVAWLVFRFSL